MTMENSKRRHQARDHEDTMSEHPAPAPDDRGRDEVRVEIAEPDRPTRRSHVPSAALSSHSNIRLVAIEDICIPPTRKPDPDIVRQLVSSIDDLGLLNPIVLTPEGDLVAGRNRVAAFVELGWSHIEARIEIWGAINRELIEIDENLVRRRLSVLERGRLLARRKEIYEAIHPEARQHARGGHAKAVAEAATETISPEPAFATDTAAKLGTSERTVQEEIRIANDLSPGAAELIEGTPLENEKVKLMELTRLPHDQQAAVAKMLVEGLVKSVKAAVAKIQRAENPADASDDKPAKSRPAKDENAVVGGTPEREAPGDKPTKSGASETKSENGGASALTLLQHLEAAARLLTELRAAGTPPGVKADEVDAAVTHLRDVYAHIEMVVEPLTATRRGRGHAQGPRANVQARCGRSKAQLSSRWDLRYVWTLHRNPAALDGPVLAVRRRVLEVGDDMVVEIARHRAIVDRYDLEERGHARTYGYRNKKGRGYEVSVWVYDHCPTAAEREEWLRRRAIENAALTSPPPDVWVQQPGRRSGGPDTAVRCKTTRAWRKNRRDYDYDFWRPSLEVETPDNYAVVIDLLELATMGKTTHRYNDSYVVYRDQPTPEELKKAGKERRQRNGEEDRGRAEQTRRAQAAAGERQRKEQENWAWDAEQIHQAINNLLRNDAGKKALARFGLKLPCTADDVNHAFRTIVKEEKPHPDQGGSDEAMRTLIELKEEALRYVEANSTTYARTG